MAKRENRPTRTSDTTTSEPTSEATSAMEERVVAFAKQLGWFAGTVHAKAEGWMDVDALNKQVAVVRDSAAELLKQLSSRGKPAAKKTPGGAGARGRSNASAAAAKGRSGGVVDAPGKKHRKPLPPGPAASRAESQAAKLRSAKPMVKTSQRRGRG